jgi:hypothetical protein
LTTLKVASPAGRSTGRTACSSWLRAAPPHCGSRTSCATASRTRGSPAMRAALAVSSAIHTRSAFSSESSRLCMVSARMSRSEDSTAR